MTKHITIPFITDFYLKITRVNPDIPQTTTVQETIVVNRTSFNEEDLRVILIELTCGLVIVTKKQVLF